MDDKRSGEILPVEVKKSSHKWEKDVCAKHIYLIEKTRLCGEASSREFTVATLVLSKISITARRDQNSALGRVA